MTGKSQHAFQRASPSPSAINFQSYLASLFDCEPDSHFSFAQFTHYEVRLTRIGQDLIQFVTSPSMPVHVTTISVRCANQPYENNFGTDQPVAQGLVSFGAA